MFPETEPKTVWIPVRVVQKPVWLLSDDERSRVDVTVTSECLFGEHYDLYSLDGRRIAPDETVLVPVTDDGL